MTNFSRGWCFEGGGPHGAVQVGMALYCQEKGLIPDIITSTSVGTINGLGYLSFLDMSWVADLWLRLTTSDIIKSHTFGWVEGFFRGGLYDPSPMRNYLDKVIPVEKVKSRNIPIYMGYTNVTTGHTVYETQEAHDIISVAMASSITPIGMSPIKSPSGDILSDNGLRHILPLKKMIELGATDIIAFSTTPVDSMPKYKGGLRLDKLGKRYLDVILDELSKKDVAMCEMWNELVRLHSPLAGGKRIVNLTVIRPPQRLPISDLTFESGPSREYIDMGYKAAKIALGG